MPVRTQIALLSHNMCVVVATGAFGILNLLTAVFVNALLEATEQNKVKEQRRERADKLQRLSKIRMMFKELDADSSGQLSKEEITNAMEILASDQWAEVRVFLSASPWWQCMLPLR